MLLIIFKVPLKLKILATSAEEDVESLTVIGCMRICGYFAVYSPLHCSSRIKAVDKLNIWQVSSLVDRHT